MAFDIQKIRKAHKLKKERLTNKEIAKQMGVTRQTVCNWLQWVVIDFDDLPKMLVMPRAIRASDLIEEQYARGYDAGYKDARVALIKAVYASLQEIDVFS